MEERFPLPYVAKLLRDKLLQEENSFLFFENGLLSNDPLVVRQAQGSISSCQSRINELKTSLEFFKTYKKDKKENKSASITTPSK